jgi:hypothetical protein
MAYADWSFCSTYNVFSFSGIWFILYLVSMTMTYDTSQELWQSLWGLFLTLLPFRRDLHMIHARFGSSVASYFVFQRLIFLQFCVLASVMVLFSIYHVSVRHQWPQDGYISGNYTGYLPLFMTYSSFQSKERLPYAAVVVLSMLGTVLFLSLTLIHEHKRSVFVEAIELENLAPFSAGKGASCLY